MDILVPLVIISLLVLLNGLFVAAEFAIIGVRPTRMAQLADAGNATAANIRDILDDPLRQDRYIATAQVGITIASLGLGMYGEHAIADWLLGPLESVLHLSEPVAHTVAVIGSLAILTFAHVVVGEMVPKSLALQYAERTALGIASSMSLMTTVFSPAVRVLNAIGNGLLGLFGIRAAETHGRLYSSDELELIVEESHEGGLISDNAQTLLHNIFDFSERRVAQVMVPRPRIQAIPLDISEEELRQRVIAAPRSRFPAYQGDLDHITGVLVVKDFVRQQLDQPGEFDLQALLRHVPSVPGAMRVERLLAAFKRSHVHMAVVVDEYGGTAGIVTLEDLVEEIVGEVRDEFDQGELPPLRTAEAGVLIARGDLLLDDLRERGMMLPSGPDAPDVETLGGLIVSLLGRVARVGDSVDVDGSTLTVEAIDGMAIRTVRITLPPVPVDSEP